jgi:hypothetical protein
MVAPHQGLVSSVSSGAVPPRARDADLAATVHDTDLRRRHPLIRDAGVALFESQVMACGASGGWPQAGRSSRAFGCLMKRPLRVVCGTQRLVTIQQEIQP